MICPKCSLYESERAQAVSQHMRYCDGTGVTKWFCKLCSLKLQNRKEYRAHNKDVGHRPADFIDKSDLSKKRKCQWCSKTWTVNLSGLKVHENHCISNPEKIPGSRAGIPRTTAEKLNLSEKMKKRHEDGRAAKWSNPSLTESYAESFFSRVIANEFLDKSVVRELPFGRYSFDFAWPHKMKVIEIDGQQHQRYAHQRESDLKKDRLAKEKGWDVMRINWKDMYANPKYWIQKAANFIDE